MAGKTIRILTADLRIAGLVYWILIRMMLQKKQGVHFVGIGGIGMSGIAEVLLNMGYCVSGSDLEESDLIRRLRSLGAPIAIGHRESNLDSDPAIVVISAAVKASNPEVIEARRRRIPVIPRAEMLAELMRLKYGVAVAGSHGKTTTTSMIASVLGDGGLDPTMVIGGRVRSLGSNAKLGRGEMLVAEADESDGTFLLLAPTIAVVTNIDREHMDYHQTMERLTERFLAFINKVPFTGLAVLCLDDPRVRGLLPQVRRRAVTYGLSPEADFQARDLRPKGQEIGFSVWHRSRLLGRLTLGLPGRHNVTNALAAVAVGTELQVPFRRAAESLESFAGVHRRFEIKGEPRGIMVIDDYGHHPAEIRATLRAIRDGWSRPLTVVFQPHRYSRTRDLFGEFLTAFDGTDRLIVTEIYPAGEEAIPGIDGEALFRSIKQGGGGEVEFIPVKEEIVGRLTPRLKTGEIVLTLGAGDIYRVGEGIIEALEKGDRGP